MKKVIAILFLISGYSISQVKAQTVSFNFSAGSNPVSGWINVAGDPSLAIRTATDPTTGISISSVATTNWTQYSGTSASDGYGATGATFFPTAVMADHWFQYSATLANYNATVPQLIISGLNKDSLYTIKMSSSNITGVNTDPTRYTVTGAVVVGYQDVNTRNNTANGAVFNNVAPDATGKVKIYVNTVAGSGDEAADISGLQIILNHSVTLVPLVAITSPANNDTLSEDNSIVINASASETGGTIQKVEFFVDTTKIGEDLATPYSFTWTTLSTGQHALKAKATDALGNTATASINVIVAPSSSDWSTTGNIGMNPAINFIGNVDSVRLPFRTKNIEQMSLSPTGQLQLNQYKNDSLGTSFLTTDTIGRVKLGGLKFTSGLTKTNDTVRWGGDVYSTVRMFFRRSPTDTDFTGVWDCWGDYNHIVSRTNDSVNHILKQSQFLLSSSSTIGGSFTLDLNSAPFGALHPTEVSLKGISYAPTTGLANLTLLVSDSLGLNNGIQITSRSINLTSPGIQFVNFPNNATGDSVLTTDASGNMHLKALSSFTSSSAGHWQLSGGTSFDSLDNVGIGTSNTQGYKLAVNGNAIFSRIKVKPHSDWPDYVFKRDYHLPSLKDLEAYINTHQHLPGVQTAAEVKKDGQDVGDNQAILLQKMEEMTLYIIKLNKKVDQLSQENQQLKKEIHHPASRKTK